MSRPNHANCYAIFSEDLTRFEGNAVSPSYLAFAVAFQGFSRI